MVWSFLEVVISTRITKNYEFKNGSRCRARIIFGIRKVRADGNNLYFEKELRLLV